VALRQRPLGRVRTPARRAAAGLAAVTLLVTGLAACDAGGSPEPPEPSVPTTATPSRLTFGAYGPADQLEALADVTEEFNTLYEPAEVEMETWATDDELVEAIKSGGDVPDVFTVSREDLAWLLDEKLTQPVDQLLDERGVDFGDNYSRDGIEAFSADNRLQCMPYGISPMVIFYNRELVDFDRMELRGLDVPAEAEEGEGRLSWNFDQFAAAADFATRPRRGTKGVYVAPTLEGLAPFIYSGGGQMFDDANDPKSLAFTDDGTQEALERSLELFRSPTLTLSEEQLDRRPPIEWFKRGKLGMMAGYRELVPGLRRVQGLEFDVIAMPTLESAATVGQVTGLCMSKDAADTPAAADFMVHLLDTPAASHVTEAGYLVPANIEVAVSDDFLQPGRLPLTSQVFNASVRNIVFPPLLSTWPELEAAVASDLDRLFNQPILDNLDEITEQIDEDSRTVLDPESVSPSASESDGAGS
jgi:multiple sugar transport system substrate-binding protein